MFYPRFVPLIVRGDKRQTVRARADADLPQPGQTLDLRYWLAKPYASRQVIIRRVPCTRVRPIRIQVYPDRNLLCVTLDGCPMPAERVPEFARRDGFDSVVDMISWYVKGKTFDVEGHLIEWSLTGGA